MTGYAVKHSIRAEDIRILRKKLKLTQKDFAKLVNVSQKTIERWESENRDITGPVTTLVHILNEYPQIEENLRVPEKEYPIRLWYMFKSEICTIIDVDERGRKVKIYNLDMILAIGYRVRNNIGIHFRNWSSSVLSEYMKKGFVLNDDMLKNGKPFGKDYFDFIVQIRK